jgi:RNA polymerase sigma factor (sigma-70 family)
VKTAGSRAIFDFIRKAVRSDGAGLTDGQLLRSYLDQRDEAAFATLVRRHGPMVLGACRRVLGHVQDAEDAFQATFIVLARKGRRVADQQTIGGWLHGVACHVALDARRRAGRRKSKEHQVEDMPHPSVTPEEGQRELLAVLDRELARLPEKYRLPVVLCELEGRSRQEAARQLGLPEGTLSSRLARARKTLARRMAGCGAAGTGASLTALFASQAGASVVPGPLVASTVRAAGGAVSAGVVALAEGVLKAMLLAKIKGAALVLLLVSTVGVGTAVTYRAAAAADAPQTPARAANPDRDDLEALRLEVEALRASLHATRERVKALEAEVHGQKASISTKTIHWNDPQKATPPAAKGDAGAFSGFARAPQLMMRGGAAEGEVRAASDREMEALTRADATVVEALQAKARVEAEAGLKSAAARLLGDPTNKEAQEALKKAVERMTSHPETAPANRPGY